MNDYDDIKKNKASSSSHGRKRKRSYDDHRTSRRDDDDDDSARSTSSSLSGGHDNNRRHSRKKRRRHEKKEERRRRKRKAKIKKKKSKKKEEVNIQLTDFIVSYDTPPWNKLNTGKKLIFQKNGADVPLEEFKNEVEVNGDNMYYANEPNAISIESIEAIDCKSFIIKYSYDG